MEKALFKKTKLYIVAETKDLIDEIFFKKFLFELLFGTILLGLAILMSYIVN